MMIKVINIITLLLVPNIVVTIVYRDKLRIGKFQKLHIKFDYTKG